MFGWNIAKSAEAMFSRWAIKRVCKFLLKKKLGKFILGDIDLDNLHVQLAAGTIHLSDLALNVDYLNHMLGSAAAVTIKEGSIGSLLVTMPWKGKGCQIEVDELEIVLAPYGGKFSQVGSETSISCQNGTYCISHDLRKLKNELADKKEFIDNTATTDSVDVHEGVKTIAKMVKWLLTSFHVKVNKLIVAFDPYSAEEKNNEFCRTLVLRIAEAECGTHISEDDKLSGDAPVSNFFGLSRLTNFVKFQGAIVEFLRVDDVEDQASGTNFGERCSGCCTSNAMTSIVTGERGGFSGTLKLSIPWKNGSLDIRKVDADAYIDHLELRFQPSSIKCFLYLYDIFKDTGKNSKGLIHQKATESVYFNAASHCHSSTLSSSMLASNMVLPSHKSFLADCCPLKGRETAVDAMLPGPHIISDWVPSSIKRNKKDRAEEEPDFGASMDQFFECFDGLRNSQSALGNSGMWNWTCSVFSAITAASNLASGSLHIPSEQQHVETNLKATIAGISLLVSFVDEDQKHSCDLKGSQARAGSYIHYLSAKIQDMLLILQVCPREMNFNATVKHIELADHFSNENDVRDFDLHDSNVDVENRVVLIQQMQAAVQGALPPFCSSTKDGHLDKTSRSVAAVFPRGTHSPNRCISTTKCESVYRNDVIKVTLLRTSGLSQCQIKLNSGSTDDSFMGPTSFVLDLPPVVLWVNFGLASKVSDLMAEVGVSPNTNSMRNGSASETFDGKHRPTSQEDAAKSSFPHVPYLSPKESLTGKIFLPNARMILCFPFEKGEDFRSYYSCDQFIALDFSSPSTLSAEKIQVSNPIPATSSKSSCSSEKSSSLHLNVVDLDVYLITSALEVNEKNNSGMQKLKFFAENILSVTDGTGRPSVISMLWQEGPVTGPWIAQRAKLLATSEDAKSRNKFVGEDYEFASVTTVKDLEDCNSLTRKEMILSSAFSIHALLSPVVVNLDSSQYKKLHSLLHQVLDWLACLASDPDGTEEDSSVSQTSICVESDSVAISIIMEAVESIKGSIQNELPGSWHSLKLKTQKFELLSVSNIGGIRSSNFLWVAHGEGNLWGSITGVPNKELLLISCSNSTMGRGDGEGSNVLASRFSGSDIIHFWDPKFLQSYASINIRCGTIVAVGGRLDWLDTMSSFFSLPSPEMEQASDHSLQKGDSERSVPCESSFVLNLVDIALSYEPYSSTLVVCDSGFDNVHEEIGEQYVACLLAASSLKLSNITVADSINRDYTIRMHDLGLLLAAVSGSKNVGDTYSVEHLRKIGYVKVAQEAHVEALLRSNCKNGHLWEVECSESDIVLDTCHDTASGLIRLASQLQQLFAPDVEESVVHLQTRWNNVQKVHESDESRIFNGDSASSAPGVHTLSVDSKGKPGLVSFMDDVCEDAFCVDGRWNGQSDICESQLRMPLDGGFLGEACNLRVRDPEGFSCNPDFIEGYFLSNLHPFSELPLKNLPSDEILKSKSSIVKNGEAQRGNSGWYGDTSLKILDNHVSDASKQTGPRRLVEDEASSSRTKFDEFGKVLGCVVLKNINVIWRMYAGSDWHNSEKIIQHSAITQGRDTTVSLELKFSGMEFQYDIFPDGGLCVSKLALSIQDFHLSDNSTDAPWKLVLGYYQSKDHPRESSAKALKLDLEAVRPDPSTPLEEYRLRVAIVPLRLHLHQCQLDFLISFFGGKSLSVDKCSIAPQDLGESGIKQKKSTKLGGHIIIKEALLPYFQKFDIWPLLVRIDYSPRRFDLAALSGGKYVELVNLFPWKGVELQLKHVQAVGVYGWSCVCETTIGDWLEDISQNQVHKLLKGLRPIGSLVAVSSGAAKLVSLPMKNYRKDHRLLKGMQRGTITFLRSISLEAIGLGVHLAAGAHDILLQAEYILTSIPPSVPWPAQSRENTNFRSNQPKDARQGIQQAFESISDGLGKSASALVRTPLKRYQRGAGVGSALATVVQAAPAAAIAPASAAARAVHCALLGVRNSLDPERKKESMDKYLGTTQPREFI